MHPDRLKMYPVGAAREVDMRGVKQIPVGTTSADIDLSKVHEDTVHISFTNTLASTLNVSNVAVGQVVMVEQAVTGVNTHAVTFVDHAITASGENVATMDAQNESIAVVGVNKEGRLFIMCNNGGVVLS